MDVRKTICLQDGLWSVYWAVCLGHLDWQTRPCCAFDLRSSQRKTKMNLMMVMMSCEIRQHECKHLPHLPPKKKNMSRTSWPSGPNESFASVCCVCFSRMYWPDNLAPIRISKLCSQNKSVLSLDSCETTRDNMRFAWMNMALVCIS